MKSSDWRETLLLYKCMKKHVRELIVLHCMKSESAHLLYAYNTFSSDFSLMVCEFWLQSQNECMPTLILLQSRVL